MLPAVLILQGLLIQKGLKAVEVISGKSPFCCLPDGCCLAAAASSGVLRFCLCQSLSTLSIYFTLNLPMWLTHSS